MYLQKSTGDVDSLIIDDEIVYYIGASIKDAGKNVLE